MLLWVPGLVRMTNGSFGSVGRLGSLLRVPDGRAGVCNRAGLLGGGWGHW